ASCRPRKLEAQFIARYSRSSALSTSTMNSPPLEVWFTGSALGGVVSAATSLGPGAAALRSARGGAACARAATGGGRAPAPGTAAPWEELRPPAAGRQRAAPR